MEQTDRPAAELLTGKTAQESGWKIDNSRIKTVHKTATSFNYVIDVYKK